MLFQFLVKFYYLFLVFPDCAENPFEHFFEFGALFCILSTLKHVFALWATFEQYFTLGANFEQHMSSKTF